MNTLDLNISDLTTASPSGDWWQPRRIPLPLHILDSWIVHPSSSCRMSRCTGSKKVPQSIINCYLSVITRPVPCVWFAFSPKNCFWLQYRFLVTAIRLHISEPPKEYYRMRYHSSLRYAQFCSVCCLIKSSNSTSNGFCGTTSTLGCESRHAIDSDISSICSNGFMNINSNYL